MQEFHTLELNIGTDFDQTKSQVEAIVADIDARHDMARINRLFNLVARGYDGWLPGYQRLQTLYHNHLHTLEVVLCTARLLHGLHLAGKTLTADQIDMSLMGALLHDVGYLKHDTENEGTGAQFTVDHVIRSTEFARAHLASESASFMEGLINVILITDHRLPASRLNYGSEKVRLSALVTGTSDLVSQMANREYLERLLLLYFEFREAGLGNYQDFDDLLEKTAAFYRVTQKRLADELEGLAHYLVRHFEKVEGVACNRYQESIDKNLAYLDRVLKEPPGQRIELLKRGGIVDRVLKKIQA
jgi:hypothetical protein